MADCCLIKKVATVEVYENKNEVRAYGFMAGDRNTPVMEVKFRHLWGEENLSKCKLRWIIVDDLGSLLVGEVPIEQDNTASIQLPNELFTGERRMKVQLTVASCDGSRILNLQQFTDLKVINNLASNEVVEPVYQMLINQVYDDTKKYLAELEASYKAKYGSLESVYAKSKASLEQYLITAENGGNAEFLQGYTPAMFQKVESTIADLRASSKYKLGDVVEVLGFHAKGDGSHHKRVAKSADDGSGELGQNGIWWCTVIKSYGVNEGDISDITTRLTSIEANDKLQDENIRISRSEIISPNRIADGTLSATKLSTASNADKIGMHNLSEGVKLAIAGTAPVNPTIGDGDVTKEKLSKELISDLNIDSIKRHGIITSGLLNINTELNTIQASNSPSVAVFETNETLTTHYRINTKTYTSDIVFSKPDTVAYILYEINSGDLVIRRINTIDKNNQYIFLGCIHNNELFGMFKSNCIKINNKSSTIISSGWLDDDLTEFRQVNDNYLLNDFDVGTGISNKNGKVYMSLETEKTHRNLVMSKNFGMRSVECNVEDMATKFPDSGIRLFIGDKFTQYTAVLSRTTDRNTISSVDFYRFNNDGTLDNLGGYNINVSVTSKLKLCISGDSLQLYANGVCITYCRISNTFIYGNRFKSGVSFRSLDTPVAYKNIEVKKQNKRYMHMSVDDVLDIFKVINTNKDVYTSIFDEPRLKVFKSMHVDFGAVVSLYVYYEDNGFNLCQMTDKFKSEFIRNSNWLKIGFHSLAPTTNYYDGSVSPSVAKTHWETITNEIGRFAGSNTIDRMPRPNYFSANKDTVKQWLTTKYAPVGLLSADDTRSANLYLTQAQTDMLENDCCDLDEGELGLYIVKSQRRIDNGLDINKLEAKVNHNQLCMFLHEANILNNHTSMRNMFTWAKENNYAFDFPMNNLPIF